MISTIILNRHFILIMLSLFLLFPLTSPALEESDQAKIEAVVANYTKAWNRHDMKDFSAAFANDADFVNVFGQRFSGRKEIEERHIKIHESFLKDSQMTIMKLSLREVRPGVVIAHVNWQLTGYREPHLPVGNLETRKGIFTQLFLLEGDHWSIVASQNTFQSSQQ